MQPGAKLHVVAPTAEIAEDWFSSREPPTLVAILHVVSLIRGIGSSPTGRNQWALKKPEARIGSKVENQKILSVRAAATFRIECMRRSAFATTSTRNLSCANRRLYSPENAKWRYLRAFCSQMAMRSVPR